VLKDHGYKVRRIWKWALEFSENPWKEELEQDL